MRKFRNSPHKKAIIELTSIEHLIRIRSFRGYSHKRMKFIVQNAHRRPQIVPYHSYTRSNALSCFDLGRYTIRIPSTRDKINKYFPFRYVIHFRTSTELFTCDEIHKLFRQKDTISDTFWLQSVKCCNL